MAGGKAVHIPLRAPDYKVDWQAVKDKINSRTKAILINTPHNPTGTLLSRQDMLELQSLVCENNLFLISDEVYEFITFDGEEHESVLRYPELFKRSFTLSSFGKTFHATGWKLGYAVAPEALTNEFRKIHQFITFTSNTPAQIGLTDMLEKHPEHISGLSSFYQHKRDQLVKILSNSRFKLLPSKGTYFLLADYSEISEKNDYDFCRWLIQSVGVAAIPLSPFYEDAGNDKTIRLCFAKQQETLELAGEKLCQL
jgi:methionine aminotransferase